MGTSIRNEYFADVLEHIIYPLNKTKGGNYDGEIFICVKSRA